MYRAVEFVLDKVVELRDLIVFVRCDLKEGNELVPRVACRLALWLSLGQSP